MVQFSELMNHKKNRQVREVVFVKGESIHIYEPSKEDVEIIVGLQERFAKSDKDKTKIAVTGEDLVSILFPLLTNVEGMEKLSKEEIAEIVDNPSLALTQASHVIEGIVTEVYKMTILSARNRILETDFRMESVRTTSEIVEKALGLANRDGKTGQLLDKIKTATEKVESLKDVREKRDNQSVLTPPVDKIKVDNTPKLSKHSTTLAQFKNTFSE